MKIVAIYGSHFAEGETVGEAVDKVRAKGCLGEDRPVDVYASYGDVPLLPISKAPNTRLMDYLGNFPWVKVEEAK